ncbi:zf-DHHC-domain-containing protein [Lentinula boryana]|uniref:Palmitoyltransferase PFA4 n=1 Tax=Lentinula boryana TaxID=40481 RepID=A0ABQ8Q6N0_9AGAR|nr:zf-DHHC-domain-containing protein [Lentinula boryana]
MSSLLGRLIVNFVLLLISFIAYSSQIFVIWPWYGRVVSVELLVLLVPFNMLVGMLLWNYFFSVTVDPGRVPQGWRPDTHSDGYEVKKLTGRPRYCKMCESFKPPRTHHCRQCGHCVLRMDHHCPWINNCVGHYNYGHFVRFLFYIDVACSYHLAMMVRRVYHNLNINYWDSIPAVEFVFILLNFVACIPVLLSVGAFSIYHFNGISNNTTTIEGWEKDKVATMVRRGKIRDVKFPYNLGRRRNIESVLGPNPLLWCWPTQTPGNGLRYELTEGEGDAVQQAWPPDDPTRPYFEEPEGEFKLPESPWTFENGGVNPDLQPYNTKLRQDSVTRRRKSRKGTGYSTFPPYHSDYQGSDVESDEDQASRSELSGDGEYVSSGRIRRGSEGYEFQPTDREDMLRRYLGQIGETPGRYHRYIPQAESDSEDDNDTPLGQTRLRNDLER